MSPRSSPATGPSTGPSPCSSGRLTALQKHFYRQPSTIWPKTLTGFISFQKEYSQISWSRERHLYPEGHAEAGRHRPLCLRPPQHHKRLRDALPLPANRVSHEEPAPPALRHSGELWHPVEQQLRSGDRLPRLRYQVPFSTGDTLHKINELK